MELLFHNSEFEKEVRKQLNIFDRTITDADALLVNELDLTLDYAIYKDLTTLLHFKNLKSLALEMGCQDDKFWKNFPKLEDLCWITWGANVDFSIFSCLHNLKFLTVSGGDYSSIAFEKLEALVPLEKLEYLQLHEFGPVDLAPLENMKQLKTLLVRYSDEVKNIEVIGTMTQLKTLHLDGLLVDNLDFLDTLPDDLDIEMCGNQILGTKTVDVSKWKRFKKRDICEIQVKDQYWEYIDLSELNN